MLLLEAREHVVPHAPVVLGESTSIVGSLPRQNEAGGGSWGGGISHEPGFEGAGWLEVLQLEEDSAATSERFCPVFTGRHDIQERRYHPAALDNAADSINGVLIYGVLC